MVTNLPPPFCTLRRFVDFFAKLFQLIPALLGSGGQPCRNGLSIFLVLVVSDVELFGKDFDGRTQRSRFVTSFPFGRFNSFCFEAVSLVRSSFVDNGSRLSQIASQTKASNSASKVECRKRLPSGFTRMVRRKSSVTWGGQISRHGRKW